MPGLSASLKRCEMDGSETARSREKWLRDIFCPSEAVHRLVSAIERVAQSNFNVIVLGETGSGKDVIARAIHQASHCCQGPFVPVDCGAIPVTLVEDELFGHEKGAFTGANARQPGKMEAARGGTLFLDEIANLPLGSQATLLRALQEKTICRLGSATPIHIEVRLLAATNEDLPKLVQTGSFRRDLYFRLNEFTVRVPPLRERREDIVYLAQHFLQITNAELQKNLTGFSDSAVEAMLLYPWPGNVRELRSCVRRAVLLADEVITEEHLDLGRTPAMQAPGPYAALPQDRQEGEPLKEIVRRHIVRVEREAIFHMLQRTGGNKAKAARLLQIDYKTMHSKVREYGISVSPKEDYEQRAKR